MSRSLLRQSSALWIGLGAFALTILFVDPIREASLGDDWSYALTVQHLLETGSYRSHDWLEANMPFQAYWGGLFAFVLGYSFTVLRISTLALVLLGLIAFYYLAREHRLNNIQAGLVTLALYASPLFLFLSFTFNTDVPFLMGFVIALFLYTRAIRLESYPLLLIASIAASAAILTRQFGLALPAGVFSLWALGKDRKGKALFFATGLVLPGAAGIWQLANGLLKPTWVQRQVLHVHANYLTDLTTLLGNFFWRPTIILQYLTLFTLPFMFLAVLSLIIDIKQGRSQKSLIVLLTMCTFVILAGAVYGHVALGRPWLLPYIPWDETITSIANMGQWGRSGLTLITLTGASLYAYIIVRRYFGSPGWVSVSVSERLLDVTTFFLLLEHLLYRGFGDRYLLGFLPFVLILVGQHAGNWLIRWNRGVVIACLTMLIVAAMWTRGRLTEAEANWQAAESVRAAGTDPRHIFGYTEWNFYHGALDDYMAEIGDSLSPNYRTVFWTQWYPQRQKQSRFLISYSTPSSADQTKEVVGKFSYRDPLFRLKYVYVLRRL
jgi:hypothetical protein